MLRDRCIEIRASVWMVMLVVSLLGIAVNAHAGDVWRVGDVFVAVNNGTYQIVRVTGSGSKATLTVVDTLNDTTPNATAGCAFTPTFRPITTSFAAGIASSIERYQISDIKTPVGHTVVVSTNTFSNGGAGKSVALDAQSSIYVGHSVGGEIDQYIQPAPGAAQTTFTLGAQFPIGANVDVAGSEWLDVTSFAPTAPTQGSPYVGYANSLYYTSGGLRIFLLTFTTSPVSNTLPPAVSNTNIYPISINLGTFKPPTGFAYHGIKILADASGNPTGLVVAAGPKIVQFNLTSATTAVLTTVYDNKGGPGANWQSVSLDTAGTGFWATDQANSKLAHFTLGTAAPDTSLSLSATPSGVCVDGSFSPGQPKLRQPTPGSVTLTTDAPINTFSIPIVYPTFYSLDQPLHNTFTTGVTFFPPPPPNKTTSVQATLYFVDYDPTNNEGVSDDGFACLKTAPPPPLGIPSPYCEGYKLETTPPIGQGYSIDLDIFLLQQTTSSFATPPAIPGPQPFGTTPKAYHDLHKEFTAGIVQDETRIKPGGCGLTCSTEFTIQTQMNTEGISCGYQPKFAPLSTDPSNAPIFGSGSTAGIKFQAALNTPTPIDCQNGTFLSDLAPELHVLKLNPANLNSSTDVTGQFTSVGCSNQCQHGLLYAPSGSQGNTTWNLQVKMPTGPNVSGSYIAYTHDINNHIPDFSAYFCIDACSQPAP